MYSYVRQAGIPTVLAQEAPALVTAFVIAELFYKFHSFTLECGAFLATWWLLDYTLVALRRRFAGRLAPQS